MTFPRGCQIQNLYQSKWKTVIFSKKTLKNLKIIFILGSQEYLAKLENQIGAYSFMVHSCKKTVWGDMRKFK